MCSIARGPPQQVLSSMISQGSVPGNSANAQQLPVQGMRGVRGVRYWLSTLVIEVSLDGRDGSKRACQVEQSHSPGGPARVSRWNRGIRLLHLSRSLHTHTLTHTHSHAHSHAQTHVTDFDVGRQGHCGSDSGGAGFVRATRTRLAAGGLLVPVAIAEVVVSLAGRSCNRETPLSRLSCRPRIASCRRHPDVTAIAPRLGPLAPWSPTMMSARDSIVSDVPCPSTPGRLFPPSAPIFCRQDKVARGSKGREAPPPPKFPHLKALVSLPPRFTLLKFEHPARVVAILRRLSPTPAFRCAHTRTARARDSSVTTPLWDTSVTAAQVEPTYCVML